MRISYLVPRCTPDNSHGRYIIELATRYSNEHKVVVYSGAFWPPIQSLVQCHWLPVPRRPAIARLAGLWAFSHIAVRLSPVDIVHNQGADAPVGNIVTAQFCNQVMRSIAGPEAGLYRRFNYALGVKVEKYCMTKPSTLRVIAVSKRVKTEIQQEYGVEPGKVVVIHHGVDAKNFHPELRTRMGPAVRDRLGLGHNEFVVLFVGGDYRRKGLVSLLEATARVGRGIRILAVEVKPDTSLQQLVSSRGLNNSVVFVGNTMDMAALYAAADCFVLPTRYDTFSLATLEAMASGLPVIVSRAAGVSELLKHDRDSLILDDPEDIDSLTEQLVRLVGDVGLRSTLGGQARLTAERHSWDEVATKTLAVYRDSLGGGG